MSSEDGIQFAQQENLDGFFEISVQGNVGLSQVQERLAELMFDLMLHQPEASIDFKCNKLSVSADNESTDMITPKEPKTESVNIPSIIAATVKKAIKEESMEVHATLRSYKNRKRIHVKLILYAAMNTHYLRVEQSDSKKLWLFSTSYAHRVDTLRKVILVLFEIY